MRNAADKRQQPDNPAVTENKCGRDTGIWTYSVMYAIAAKLNINALNVGSCICEDYSAATISDRCEGKQK